MSLRDLIKAVEAGALCQGDFISIDDGDLIAAVFPLTDDVDAWEYVSMAVDGSLDAAKALHDAVLPGWEWHLGPSNAKVYPYNGNPGRSWVGMADNPARAWLLAILRAMEARDVNEPKP